MRYPGRRAAPALVAVLSLCGEVLAAAPGAHAYRQLGGTCLVGAPAAAPIHWIEGGGSLAACETACQGLPACGGYSFIRAGCDGPGARCLLIRKDSGVVFNADPCCTSGLRE